MEKQFSLNSEQAREARLSNSLVGQLILAEIPNLNILYEGPEGVAVCHLWDGKYVIHSELYSANPSKEDVKRAMEVSREIDKAFKEKGIDRLYTWAENETQAKYNQFLGYKKTGNTVNNSFVDKDYPTPVFEYVKEL